MFYTSKIPKFLMLRVHRDIFWGKNGNEDVLLISKSQNQQVSNTEQCCWECTPCYNFEFRKSEMECQQVNITINIIIFIISDTIVITIIIIIVIINITINIITWVKCNASRSPSLHTPQCCKIILWKLNILEADLPLYIIHLQEDQWGFRFWYQPKLFHCQTYIKDKGILFDNFQPLN